MSLINKEDSNYDHEKFELWALMAVYLGHNYAYYNDEKLKYALDILERKGLIIPKPIGQYSLTMVGLYIILNIINTYHHISPEEIK